LQLSWAFRSNEAVPSLGIEDVKSRARSLSLVAAIVGVEICRFARYAAVAAAPVDTFVSHEAPSRGLARSVEAATAAFFDQ
jgi:hypothetical protein